MKKLWLILIILALLLTGCAETTISCGVDAEMNAYLDLEHRCDWSDVDENERRSLRNGFKALVDHYEDKPGFTVEEEYTDTGCSLKATKVCPAESYAEAFAALETMLNDTAVTPFVEVHTEQRQQEGIEGYAMALTLDAGSFLDRLDIEHFPGDLQQYFRQSIESSTVTVKVALPASELVYGPEGAVCADGMARAETAADLSGQTTISLATLALIRDGQVVEEPQTPMEARILRLERETRILTGALCGVGLLLLIFVILLLYHSRKVARGKQAERCAAEIAPEQPEAPEAAAAPEETESPGEKPREPNTPSQTATPSADKAAEE